MPVTEEESGGVTLATLDSDLGIINANLTNGNTKVTQTGSWVVIPVAAGLAVAATAASGAAVTATLPAVAGAFHNITLLEIQAYSAAARTGAATPIVVTSTNLHAASAWTFATAAAIGTTDAKTFVYNNPLQSLTVATATTIVCPATTGIIWRVNIAYYAL